MMTTADLLAAAKRAQGIPSNYRLARVLDVPESTVQRWNTRRGLPDDRYTVRLAELAGVDPAVAVASIRAEREAEGPLRALWEGIADRLQRAGLAALAVIVSMFIGGGPDGAARASQRTPAPVAPVAGSGLYIMLTN